MSYVDSGLLTKSNTTPLLILSSGADVQYDPEPDYRLLTVSGKGVTYKDLTISNGGIVYVGTSARVSSAEIHSGAKMSASGSVILRDTTIFSGGTASVGVGVSAVDVTVKSGGSLRTSTSFYFSNTTVESGGYVSYGGQVYFCGTGNSIAKGTLYKREGAYTVDGVLYDYDNGVDVGAHAANFNGGIVVSNLKHGSILYVRGASILRDIWHGAGNLVVYGNAYIYNFVDHGTSLTKLELNSAANASFGGVETDIPAGMFWYMTNSKVSGGVYGGATQDENA